MGQGLAVVPFDIYGPQFTVGEAATILGIKPTVLAMWGQRGVGPPTRREGGSGKRRKKGSRKGKGRFSAQDLVKLGTQQMLSEMGFSLGGTVPVGEEVRLTPDSVAQRLSAIEAQEIAETVAMTGEWMWAMARSIERGRPYLIYAYAARAKDKWQFDMHVENPGVEKPSEPPCFGWEVPHIYVPVGEIFSAVYNDCKKLLGITTEGNV
jgi:DNA-binding transcriptional MerR regulator